MIVLSSKPSIIYCEANEANEYSTYFKKRVGFSVSGFSPVKVGNLNKLLVIMEIKGSLIEIGFKRIDEGIFGDDYISLSEVWLTAGNLLLKVCSS